MGRSGDLFLSPLNGLPSGKCLHNYGKSPFLMGKSTISMAIFNSYVSHYQKVATTRIVPCWIFLCPMVGCNCSPIDKIEPLSHGQKLGLTIEIQDTIVLGKFDHDLTATEPLKT